MDLLSSTFKRLNCMGKRKISCIMAGLDAVGKSAVLYRLYLGKLPEWSVPTVGFHVEIIEHHNTSFTLWDISGGYKIKDLWHCYYANCQGLLFDVDSTDRDKMKEAETELANVVIGTRSTALFCNFNLCKQTGLVNVMSVEEIKNIFNPNIFGTHVWHIQPASAVTGQGLHKGLEWLANEVLKKQ